MWNKSRVAKPIREISYNENDESLSREWVGE